MSIKQILAENTTNYQYKGLTYFKNPGVNVHITSDGQVFNPKTKKFMKESPVGTFNISLMDDEGKAYSQASFQSLLSKFFGIEKSVAQIIVPKDQNLGFVPDNLEVIENPRKPGPRKGTPKAAPRQNKETYVANPSVKKIPVDVYEKSKEIELYGVKLQPVKVEHKFICDDGLSFDNKKHAEEHQVNVEFAKQICLTMVEKKAGYPLAEEIFLMHVSYTAENKPYSSFKDMLNAARKGIVEEGAVQMYKFSPNNELGELSDILLDDEFECTLDVAKQICKALKEMNEAVSKILNLV